MGLARRRPLCAAVALAILLALAGCAWHGAGMVHGDDGVAAHGVCAAVGVVADATVALMGPLEVGLLTPGPGPSADVVSLHLPDPPPKTSAPS